MIGPIFVKTSLNVLDSFLGLLTDLPSTVICVGSIKLNLLVFTRFLIPIHVLISCQFCNFQNNFENIFSSIILFPLLIEFLNLL